MYSMLFAPLLSFTLSCCHSLPLPALCIHSSHSQSVPCLCFMCGTHECRCYHANMGTYMNNLWKFFSESVYAAVETVVLNMESCELKMATKANQHHSLFAKSSISSCLIQKTLQFITHTCCTHNTEPTAAHNKHSCGNTIPLSIYITSLLASMQIKLIPHRIGDLTGTASRPDGIR